MATPMVSLHPGPPVSEVPGHRLARRHGVALAEAQHGRGTQRRQRRHGATPGDGADPVDGVAMGRVVFMEFDDVFLMFYGNSYSFMGIVLVYGTFSWL